MLKNWITALLITIIGIHTTSCKGAGIMPKELQATGKAPFILKEITALQQVSQLTGKESINKTDRYGVYGTDLGSMFNAGDKTYLVFGDTFGYRSPDAVGAGGENWRSNILAVTSDEDPADGLTFDEMIVNDQGEAIELLPSLKEDHNEMTKIPTYGVNVAETLYLFYMSVRHWGEPGEWDANYSGIAKSVDEGQTWEFIESAKWPGDSNFIQVSSYKVVMDDDTTEIYFWSIPAGRFGGVKLMKVNEKFIEDISKYEYYIGTDEDGNPLWSQQMENAVLVVDDTVGELSVIWNPFLKRWIMMYMQDRGGIVMREGLTPWGPWGKPLQAITQGQYPGLYSPYMNQKYIENDGEFIYFTLSLWGPYNVFWMKVRLVKH